MIAVVCGETQLLLLLLLLSLTCPICLPGFGPCICDVPPSCVCVCEAHVVRNFVPITTTVSQLVFPSICWLSRQSFMYVCEPTQFTRVSPLQLLLLARFAICLFV
ncbi:unnamed protein product [Ceratitis capitata]|uniref:(Mediterranean fruit fly) hypothetical protein n=1 Tax=Ceratitis capitata TaxID=7213 RepID=A0A811V4B1_CERCA|nr:unnamed protein product [Ceratitis capitata]